MPHWKFPSYPSGIQSLNYFVFLTNKDLFSHYSVLCDFKIKFLYHLLLVLHYILSLCIYNSCWLQWEPHCRARHSFARGLLTINAKDWNMWRVNFFYFKRYKYAWGLTQSQLQSTERFPSISEGFGSDWHLLFILGYVAWILITEALYTDYKSCCSHRDCYSLAAHSSQAVFENHSVFCWWLLANHRVLKIRVCQHCQQQCDTVKSKVVTSQVGDWKCLSVQAELIYSTPWLKYSGLSWQESWLLFALGSEMKCRHMQRNWIHYNLPIF